jgi:acetyl esterase/lipase
MPVKLKSEPQIRHFISSLLFSTMCSVAVSVLMTLAMPPARAQPVSWKPAMEIQGDTDISNLGTPIDAIQAYAGKNDQGTDKAATDLTVDDTTFHAIQAIQNSNAIYGDGTISITTGAKAQFYPGYVRAVADDKSQLNALPTSTGVSSNYSMVVSNGISYSGLAIGTLTFSNLQPGHLYQMQIWGLAQNGRRNLVNFIDSLQNIGTIDTGALLPKTGPLVPGHPYGQSIIGVFLAKNSTAAIDWGGGDGNTQPGVSAIALRDVTTVPGMKETVAAIGPPPPIQPIHDPSGFDEWQDLTYTRIGHHSLKLDLFVPRDATKPVPLVVYIHGGGWSGLDKTEGFANALIHRGFALARVDYRLSGEAIWPAQIYDCKAAVRWLRAHASDYGYGSDKIGAMGDSAGGHLVAMLGLTNDNPEFEGDEGTPKASSSVQAVADYFGPSDLTTLSVDVAGGAVPRLLGGLPANMIDKARSASPLYNTTSKAPPFVIVHGELDQIVPIQQSTNLNNALIKAGVKSQMYVMKGKPHGANEEPAMDLVVALFNEYLR